MIIEFKVFFFFLNTAILSMCDYYAFACRFQCLPETHHFSPNWISYIIAYIWLITNDGIPSRYEHRVNYSKKFIFISILSHIMILQRWFLPKKQREKSLQKKKRKIYPAPTCFSLSLYVKSEYFYCWTHQIHITANTASRASSLILLKKCYQT